jgi:alpha-D-xyloside xylohydrolase
VREDTVIPVGANSERPDYEYAQDVCLQVFNLRDGADLWAEVPDIHGKVAATFQCVRKGKTLRITREGATGRWSVQLRGAGERAVISTESNEIEVELE